MRAQEFDNWVFKDPPSREICGECRYHSPQKAPDGRTTGWWCQNIDSENCAMFTDYDDTCEAWESRGIE